MNRSLRTGVIVLGVVAVILVLFPLLWGSFGGWGITGRPGMMWGYGFGWLMPLYMIVFWGLIIWGLIALVRGLSREQRWCESSRQDSALEVLKRRYAQGEINREEYEEKRKALT